MRAYQIDHAAHGTPLDTKAIADNDEQLLDFLQRIVGNRQDRRAVIIHLSRLLPQHRRDHHIRISLDSFEQLVQRYEGALFLLSNKDIVFIAKGASANELSGAAERIRLLFDEDPLAQKMSEILGQFSSWYNLEHDFSAFQAAIRRAVREGETVKRALKPKQKLVPRQLRPLSPNTLALLETRLARNDLGNFMRRQEICSYHGTLHSLFHELYVSIADLAAVIAPDIDLLADLWLFRHFTQVLDRRMLAMLAENDTPIPSGAFSLNLNVATILSPEFIVFDQARMSLRSKIIIEIQKVDIFADLGAFFFARDYLRERGYRICLDGLNFLSLPFVDRHQLGVDLLKVQWSSELDRTHSLYGAAEMRSLIEKAGPARVILSRVDRREGIEFGRSLGISLFQGRYLEPLINDEMAPPASLSMSLSA